MLVPRAAYGNVRQIKKMDANILKSFFEGKTSTQDLENDLEGTTIQTGKNEFRHIMIDLSEDFNININHLIMLCDAVTEGKLEPARLEEISCGIIASECFTWSYDTEEGDLIAEVLHDWDSPSINYKLTIDTISKFRHRLLTGEDIFDENDLGDPKTNNYRLTNG